MNLYSKNLILCFFAALLMTLFHSAFHTSWAFCYFAPFLVIVFYQKPLRTALWISLGCGLLLDSLSSHPKFGLHATAFVMTASLLYGQKKRFFADHLSTLPIMTFFYSLISTCILISLHGICEKSFPVSKVGLFTDCIAMALADGILAFGYYILPFILLGKTPRRGKDYFEGRG